jgi:hypothetical protein
MPYGTEVAGVFRGNLPSEAALPASGNHIGDMYLVGHTPWVWLVTSGTSAPQWIDP